MIGKYHRDQTLTDNQRTALIDTMLRLNQLNTSKASIHIRKFCTVLI
jgi:hypothetical protein